MTRMVPVHPQMLAQLKEQQARATALEETNQALRQRLEAYEQREAALEPLAILHLVYAGCYDERWLVAVYTNEDDAKAHAATIDKREQPDVLQETLLTELPKELRDGLRGFQIRGNPDDKRTWCTEEKTFTPAYQHFWYNEGPLYKYPTSVGPSHGKPRKNPDNFTWCGWARDNEHAKQLATVALSNHEHKTGCHPIEQNPAGITLPVQVIEDDGEPIN